MNKRHIKFSKHYVLKDNIKNHNFYGNFQNRYKKLSVKSTTPNGKKIEVLLVEY